MPPMLINTHQLIDDDWVTLGDDQAVADGDSKIIVSLARLQKDFEALRKQSAALAVKLEETTDVNDIAPFLNDLQMIVLQFKVFTDGRAYSQAKLLRQRYAYQGQIRAVGAVTCDQLSFMQRCGFSQFQLAESEDIGLALNAFNEFSAAYQPELEAAHQQS